MSLKQDYAMMIECNFIHELCGDLKPKHFLCLNMDGLDDKLEPTVYGVLRGFLPLDDKDETSPGKPCQVCELICSPGKCMVLRGAIEEIEVIDGGM